MLELEWILMEMGAIKGPQHETVWLKYRVDKFSLQKSSTKTTRHNMRAGSKWNDFLKLIRLT